MTAFLHLLFFSFFLIPSSFAEHSFKYEDFREEDVIGLQEFIGKLDEETREVIIELLEAKQNPNSDDQERLMRHIMRKQSIDTLDKLVELYRETEPKLAVHSSVLFVITSVILYFTW